MLTTLETHRPIADTVFRVLFSSIFVTAGFGHLARPDGIVARLEAAPLAGLATAVAPAEALVLATGAVLLAGGLMLLLGAATRRAAALLAACLIPITITVQVAPGQLGPLFKNVALLGGLVHFAFAGARGHAWSVDGLLAARRARRRSVSDSPAAEVR